MNLLLFTLSKKLTNHTVGDRRRWSLVVLDRETELSLVESYLIYHSIRTHLVHAANLIVGSLCIVIVEIMASSTGTANEIEIEIWEGLWLLKC